MSRQQRNTRAARTFTARASSTDSRELARNAATAADVTGTESMLWWIAVAGTVAVPLTFSLSGQESFRLPQELLLRAVGIGLAAVVLVACIVRGKRPGWIVLSPLTARIVGLIAPWTIITTLTSSRPAVSCQSLMTALSAVVLFVSITILIRRRSLRAIYWVFIPAFVNAAFYLLQEFRIWNPLTGYAGFHSANGALLGNANDVGAFLVVPCLAAGVLTIVHHGVARVAAAVCAAFLSATLVISQTLTAIVALAVGVVTLAIVLRPRRSVAITFGSVVLGMILLVAYSPVRQRVQDASAQFHERTLNQLLSGRMTAWLVAWEMGRDHPLFGIGLGTYGTHYFYYKLRVDMKYPQLAAWPKEVLGYAINFGEAHSDHLQVLAETGWPGYALLLAALIVLGRQSVAPREVSSRASFARLLALPAAAAFGVLALAQFPLRLAGVITPALFLAGACVAWGKK